MSTEAQTAPRKASVLQGLNLALRDAMRADPSVFVMGEDVQVGTYGMTPGLYDEFGGERVRNTPISEAAMVGAAVGAAMCGMRPVLDLSIATFAYVALDQLVNQAAKNRYLFGTQASVPATFYFVNYHRSHAAAQHTDRPHPIFMGIPGFKVVAPSTPQDAYGLMTSAIQDPDPVIVFGDMTLLPRQGELTPGAAPIPIGKAKVVREGNDVTLVSFFMLPQALAAAERLAAEGISVEVIDPRTLAPLDMATISASVRKTGRLVVADVANETCSAASEVIASVTTTQFGDLRAAPRRVCAPMLHVPFCPPLEKRFFPQEAEITTALRDVVGRPERQG